MYSIVYLLIKLNHSGSSSGISTIYPSTLAHPTLTNPWVVQHDLVDKMIHYSSDFYDLNHLLKPGRPKAKSSMKQGAITPSGLGEHSQPSDDFASCLTRGRRPCSLFWRLCQKGQASYKCRSYFGWSSSFPLQHSLVSDKASRQHH